MGQNSPRNPRRLPATLAGLIWPVAGICLLWWTQTAFLAGGLPFTHDGELHLVRLAQYYVAVKEGQFPPRWGGGLNNGFGYPVFNFNYPLANILAYPLIAANLSVVTADKILCLAALTLGFLGFWGWLAPRTGRRAALVGGLFYALNPYVLELIYVRGSLGELWAFALLPWVMGGMTRVVMGSRPVWFWTAVAIAAGGAFLISHNVMVLLAGPLLVGYAGWLRYRYGLAALGKLGLPAIIIGCLGAFFWVPAWVEKGFTVLDAVPITRDYLKHFPTIAELAAGAWGYGFSNPGPVDGLSLFIGLPQLSVIALAIILAVRLPSRSLRLLTAGLLVLAFILLPISRRLWEILPLLHYIQFPWRWLLFIQTITALLTAVAYRETAKWRWFWAGVLIVLLASAKHMSVPIDRISPTNQDLFYATVTTSTLDENMPKGFDKNVNYSLKQTAFQEAVVTGAQSRPVIEVQTWTGTRHEYRATLTAADKLVERTAYFPGWIVTVDGRPVPVDDQTAGYPGLISFAVEPGTHVVRTVFSQNTPARKAGNGLTLAGLALAVGYTWYLWRNSPQPPSA